MSATVAIAAIVMALLGQGERAVVDRLGAPAHVQKTAAGETWCYPEACLELERGLVRSGCWKRAAGTICYYDAAKPRPGERPCSTWCHDRPKP